MMYDYQFKIVLTGPSNAGKTQLLNKYCKNKFDDPTVMTCCGDFLYKQIKQEDGKIIKVQFWDTAGQERFKTITSAYYRGAVGICVCFDLSDFESFRAVAHWLKEVK